MEVAPLQHALEGLRVRREAWGLLSPERRVGLLRQCLACTQAVADAWARTASDLRGLSPESPLAGEEMAAGPFVLMRLLRLLAEAAAGKVPRIPAHLADSGRTVAHVFPLTAQERLLWPGFRGEVWIEPGRPAARRDPWHQDRGPVRLALVLGAGNNTSIAPGDAVHALFAENCVALLKLHPVTARLQPLLEQALAPLVQGGFLALVIGGPEEGRWLAHHEWVDTVHLTGSHQTHDALVWGTEPEDREARKREGRPLLDKPVSSELGCVTPVLVVPGPWSEADMIYQARHVAGMVTHNSGFNCTAAQVLVTDRRWVLRETFLNRLRRELSRLPARPSWYPGARERFDSLVGEYPQAEALGRTDGADVPWTLVPDVSPREGEPALEREAFCGVLFESPVEAGGARPFLDTAVDFVNERARGNLAAVVLVHPATARAHRAALESALERLRYGALGVNVWCGVVFGLPELPWGAFPGNPLEDIRSGRGFAHNAFGFHHPEKSVLRAPFRTLHVPPWFPGHRNLLGVARSLCAFEADPDWSEAFRVGVESLKAGLLPGGL